MKIADDSVSQSDRRERARTWYSLYTLEVFFAEISGRPKSSTVNDVTIPDDLIRLPEMEPPTGAPHLHNPLSLYSHSLWLDFIEKGGYIPSETFESVMMPQALRDEGGDTRVGYTYHRILLAHISDRISIELIPVIKIDVGLNSKVRYMGSTQS